MRAIILSAGQGKRLLPLTREIPKCLLEVCEGTSLLDYQLRTLAACGVGEASVWMGFGADRVEEHLADAVYPGLRVHTRFNPLHASSDNLVTAWLARSDMDGDFLLMNGDTLFDAEVLRRLLAARPAPVTLAIHAKDRYDDDDMKVSLDGSRLSAVAKTLRPESIDAESIGLMRFQGLGVTAFRNALDGAIREPEALGLWYLSAVNGLADSLDIQALDIGRLWWAEVDNPRDLRTVRSALRERLACVVGRTASLATP